MKVSTPPTSVPAPATVSDPTAQGTAKAIAAQVAGLYGPEAVRMAPCLALGTRNVPIATLGMLPSLSVSRRLS